MAMQDNKKNSVKGIVSTESVEEGTFEKEPIEAEYEVIDTNANNLPALTGGPAPTDKLLEQLCSLDASEFDDRKHLSVAREILKKLHPVYDRPVGSEEESQPKSLAIDFQEDDPLKSYNPIREKIEGELDLYELIVSYPQGSGAMGFFELVDTEELGEDGELKIKKGLEKVDPVKLIIGYRANGSGPQISYIKGRKDEAPDRHRTNVQGVFYQDAIDIEPEQNGNSPGLREEAIELCRGVISLGAGIASNVYQSASQSKIAGRIKESGPVKKARAYIESKRH